MLKVPSKQQKQDIRVEEHSGHQTSPKALEAKLQARSADAMERLEDLSMEMLRVSSNKVVDTLSYSHSSTNMSKSISGVSLASQATQRTKCSSGFSSIGGSVRGSTLSSITHTPGGDPRGSSITGAESDVEPAPSSAFLNPATRGGGKTVLGGVAASMHGMLRRRARFSGWKTEAVYFELRSTALLAFTGSGPGGSGASRLGMGHQQACAGVSSNGGSQASGSSGSLATLASKILHHQQRPVGEWSWSMDLAGAERVVKMPTLTRKDTYAFAVEFPSGSKKRALVLAANSASARERWIAALDRARHRVDPQDFEPMAVIGEGHFGKVLLVRWKNGAAVTHKSSTPPHALASVALPPRLTEEADEGEEEAQTTAAAKSTDTGDRYLAVKEVALHKGTSLPGVLNERQILGVLREHPFVVTLRCAWRRGNFLYYGLDFLPGADLFELFRRNSIKMDLPAARMYAGQIALALEHLHAHGICYRDLKPENILVDANGYLRLADMGLSKIVGTGPHALRTTTVCGTRAYLAPEMILRKPYGLSVDFWQFGCFVYELYAGHSPFWTPRSGPPGRASDQTVALILAGEIHYPRSIGTSAKTFIKALLHPEVESRLGCGRSLLPTPSAAAAASDESSDSARQAGDQRQSTPSPDVAVPGWQDVKQHAFFEGLDWEALLKVEIAAPIKPGAIGRGMVGNFAREYTRQRAGWGGDQQELRDVAEKEGLFRRELMGFDFFRG